MKFRYMTVTVLAAVLAACSGGDDAAETKPADVAAKAKAEAVVQEQSRTTKPKPVETPKPKDTSKSKDIAEAKNLAQLNEAADKSRIESFEALGRLKLELTAVLETTAAGFSGYETEVKALDRRKPDLSMITQMPEAIDSNRIQRLEKMLPNFISDEKLSENLTAAVRRSNTYNKSVEQIGEFFSEGEMTPEKVSQFKEMDFRMKLRRGKVNKSLSATKQFINRAETALHKSWFSSLSEQGRLTERSIRARQYSYKVAVEMTGVIAENVTFQEFWKEVCSHKVGELEKTLPVELDSDEAKDNLTRGQLKSGKAYLAAMKDFDDTLEEACFLKKDLELDEETAQPLIESLKKDFARAESAYATFDKH